MKYDNIDFSPPDGVIAAAKRGLELHEKGYTGSNLEPATVAWARRIAKGESISPEKARQGYRFMKRNKRFAGFPKDSPAYASYMLWFGKPGEAWFNKLWGQMEAVDAKRSVSLMPYSGINDESLPENIKSKDANERKVFVSAFNNAYNTCKGDKNTCESKAFAVANAAVNKLTRSVQDIPNFRNASDEEEIPLCANCWFYTNQWCFKYNSLVSWDSVCDSHQVKPNMISIENNPNSSMVSIDLANDKTLETLYNEIKPYYVGAFSQLGIGINWEEPKDFHITLVYLTENSSLDFNPLADIDMSQFNIEIDGITTFECEDEEYAIVLTIKPNESLKALQSQIYQKLYDYPISEYSVPLNWNPHITLGYYKEDEYVEEELESFSPPKIKYTSIKIQRINYQSWDKIWSSKKLDSTTEDILRIDSLIRSINELTYGDEEYTEFVMLGFPYRGPITGNSDLHKSRFTPATDLGDLSHAMPVYLDHGLIEDSDQDTNEFLEYFRYRPLGTSDAPVKAVIGEETAEGRLLKVLVSKRSRYEQMLRELHKMGILRGSAQSLASIYAKDKNGDILRFHPGEFSFTVTPSNDYNIVTQVNDIIRSIGEEFMKKDPINAMPESEDESEMEKAKAFPFDKKEEDPKAKKEGTRTEQILAEYATEQPLEQVATHASVEANLEQSVAILEEVRAIRSELRQDLAQIMEGVRAIYTEHEALTRAIGERTPEQLAILMRTIGKSTEAAYMAMESTRMAPAAPIVQPVRKSAIRDPWEGR